MSDIKTLADNALSRIDEMAQYQTNINSYGHMLNALPQGDVPPDILQYMSTPAEHLPFEISDITRMSVADYQLRNRLRNSINAEKVQQNVVRRALAGLQAQIPPDQYDQAIMDAQARRVTQ